ncbi:hypothetical protein [Paenibacillus peoriae]|nr:hypothetical protein [Paenibacillus peoriae]
MSKRLEGNGLWESSCIFILEHKEAYLKLMKGRQNTAFLSLGIRSK